MLNEEYKGRIMSMLSDIDCDRYYTDILPKNKIFALMDLVEGYVVMAIDSKDQNSINEAKAFHNRVMKLADEFQVRQKKLNEGFFNPFTVGDVLAPVNPALVNTPLYSKKDDDGDDVKISKVRLWNSNTDNKIMFKNGVMIAGQYFGRGDTIESCPIRILYEKDLYSENVRSFVFPIDQKRGLYAVPFGYATFYRNSLECKKEPNAEYEVVLTDDIKDSYIKIKATKRIRKGDEIILSSDESDFVNEIKPGQFEYEEDGKKYVSTKNFKFL